MRKLILSLCFNVFLCTYATAEIYYGIDIDDVYHNGDWSSQEKIKDIIDDYTLLLEYQTELSKCESGNLNIECLDTLAEKILNRFYAYNLEENITNYHDYVKATFGAYGVVYCLNKYLIPSGSACHQENYGKTFDIIAQYLNTLLEQVNKEIMDFNFIKKYKK
ncbi:MAG: hypothetical protein J5895_03730 [Alphaproteobacteria bacterium]|nr:hypothetical protein [Alphaproteobacteria bacterium]